MNQINDGTTGMIYAIPFGDMEKEDGALGGNEFDKTILEDIRSKGSLTCGVMMATDEFHGEGNNSKLSEMFLDFCHTLAAALFNGNNQAVKVIIYSDDGNSSYVALDNGTIDVLSGARVNQIRDFKGPPSLGGFHFSTPYYFGNETADADVSFFALATRDGDALFSSFVNSVVLATIHAQENVITNENSKPVPVVSLFGSSFNWALRDAIAFSGSYDQIYTKHFDGVFEEDRGRNALNKAGGPQMHSLPGLHP